MTKVYFLPVSTSFFEGSLFQSIDIPDSRRLHSRRCGRVRFRQRFKLSHLLIFNNILVICLSNVNLGGSYLFHEWFIEQTSLSSKNINLRNHFFILLMGFSLMRELRTPLCICRMNCFLFTKRWMLFLFVVFQQFG